MVVHLFQSDIREIQMLLGNKLIIIFFLFVGLLVGCEEGVVSEQIGNSDFF